MTALFNHLPLVPLTRSSAWTKHAPIYFGQLPRACTETAYNSPGEAQVRRTHDPSPDTLYHHNCLSRHRFVTANYLPNSRPHFFLTCDMDDQSRFTTFWTLYESALQAYEKKTGITLAGHPLGLQLQNCHTVESMAVLVQGQVSSLGEFRGKDRVSNSIARILSILTKLSATASLDGAVGLVRQRVLMECSYLTSFSRRFPLVDAIHLGLAVLLGVCALL